ncbi:MAG: DUF4279 domain-containing protein [Pseudomonadota bacterium]
MSAPDYTKASLRIWGDDLVPEEISDLLGTKPSASERKGDAIVGKITKNKCIAKTGGWRLSAPVNHDGDLDAQINELFAQLPTDTILWRDLATKYRIDVFCGVFMKTGNVGIHFSAATLRLLGERGARLGLDIYDADDG